MGPHIVVLPDDTEVPIVDANKTTDSAGKKIRVGEGVELTAIVHENIDGKASSVRFEVMEKGHREAQVFYGRLPELGNIDFMTTAGRVSIFHKEKA